MPLSATTATGTTDGITGPGTVWPYYPDLLARPVPRYTSYPTAMEFTESVVANDYTQALADMAPATDLSLYVHIPYCHEICWYCGCNTGAANRKQRLESYQWALEQEMAAVAHMLGGRGRVRRIAFGGGSPNAIAPVDFVRLIDRLLILFSADKPAISVELDPRSFTLEWALMLAAIGTSRVSLGVQTFAPHIQAAIGRVQPREMIESCMAALRLRGINQINFDLMYGLPGQSLADLEDTIAQAIAMRPTRIALFGYAHLPAMIPRQRRIDGSNLPDAELRFMQSERGYAMLTQAGYIPIGFDHFALPEDALSVAALEGSVHRNFQGFTEDDMPVMLGFGASAISKFPHLLVQNRKNVGEYRAAVKEGHLPTERGVRLDDQDQVAAAIIEQLLCQSAANIDDAVINPIWPTLAPYAERGLLVRSPAGLTITDAGRPYARLIASQFDRFRNTAALSPAV